MSVREGIGGGEVGSALDGERASALVDQAHIHLGCRLVEGGQVEPDARAGHVDLDVAFDVDEVKLAVDAHSSLIHVHACRDAEIADAIRRHLKPTEHELAYKAGYIEGYVRTHSRPDKDALYKDAEWMYLSLRLPDRP